jgi:FMN-dependent NADH-azoreductase
MSTLLQLKTSIFASAGESSRLADEFVTRWRAAHLQSRVIVRDLAANPAPHLTAERFLAFSSKPETRSGEQQAALDYSNELIEELRQADEIVIAAPMYNFGIPSSLKAYFDHVARSGVTFRYTPDGPVGLLQNKRVTVIATRGGFYVGATKDAASQYLRDFLAFVGLRNIEFVYAEGLGISPEQKQRALSEAQRRIRALASADALAAVA